MTFDSTAEQVVIGEDFTFRSVVGVLDPGSLGGLKGNAEWSGIVSEYDVLSVYADVEKTARELRARGGGVAIAFIEIAPFLDWCSRTGTDPLDPGALQAAADSGVSDDVFDFGGSFAAVLRARYVREALLTSVISEHSETEGVLDDVTSTIEQSSRLYRLIASSVEGYFQLVISLDVAPVFVSSSVMADYAGLTSTGRGATALFSGLSDGRGEAVFETDADRLSALGLLGLVVLRGGTVLIRSFGDHLRDGVRGVSVYGWRLVSGRVSSLEEADALLLQYATGGAVDDDVSFILAPTYD
jgi:hypothetical protein